MFQPPLTPHKCTWCSSGGHYIVCAPARAPRKCLPYWGTPGLRELASWFTMSSLLCCGPYCWDGMDDAGCTLRSTNWFRMLLLLLLLLLMLMLLLLPRNCHPHPYKHNHSHNRNHSKHHLTDHQRPRAPPQHHGTAPRLTSAPATPRPGEARECLDIFFCFFKRASVLMPNKRFLQFVVLGHVRRQWGICLAGRRPFWGIVERDVH